MVVVPEGVGRHEEARTAEPARCRSHRWGWVHERAGRAAGHGLDLQGVATERHRSVDHDGVPIGLHPGRHHGPVDQHELEIGHPARGRTERVHAVRAGPRNHHGFEHGLADPVGLEHLHDDGEGRWVGLVSLAMDIVVLDLDIEVTRPSTQRVVGHGCALVAPGAFGVRVVSRS